MTGVFDVHAAGYAQVATTAVGRAHRARVWSTIRRWVAPGSRVIDLGCGPGIDAIWLADELGCVVVAVDQSSEMVRVARASVDAAGLSHRVAVDEVDLATMQPGQFGQVDAVLANFGVANCVPRSVMGDLLSALVRPGGHAIVVPMGPIAPTELIQGLVRRNRALLHRRRSGATDEPGYEGLTVEYHTPGQLAAGWDHSFDLVAADAVGVVAPTFEQGRSFEAAWATRLLTAGDRLFGPSAARLGIGDHLVAVLERRAQTVGGDAP